MKTITVGAFEAKTHLSQLLSEVEKGAEVRITRRGRLVAVMRQEHAFSEDESRRALTRVASRRGALGEAQIETLISEGRER